MVRTLAVPKPVTVSQPGTQLFFRFLVLQGRGGIIAGSIEAAAGQQQQFPATYMARRTASTSAKQSSSSFNASASTTPSAQSTNHFRKTLERHVSETQAPNNIWLDILAMVAALRSQSQPSYQAVDRLPVLLLSCIHLIQFVSRIHSTIIHPTINNGLFFILLVARRIH
jgi:hypothetical protein